MKRMAATSLALLAVISAANSAAVQQLAPLDHRVAGIAALPSLREQAQIQQEWIAYRTMSVLPTLMQEHGIQYWVLSQREYHEDVAWRSVASPIQMAARRRTVIVYALDDSGRVTDRSFVSFEDTIWGEVEVHLASVGTGLIALNIDANFAFSDGLAAGELEAMTDGLKPSTVDRIVRRPLLGMDFIAIRAPTMLPYYQTLMAMAHAIIKEAFSTAVITAGITTCDDVRWWMREAIIKAGLAAGFHPSFSVHRRGVAGKISDSTVILRGDLLHCDFGHIGMGLWTDTQHMGYVLLEGETAAPAGLRDGLAKSNKAQDSMLRNLKPGRTGDAVLAAVVSEMEAAGIDSLIYTHPIGDHMHGAGATIGLSDYGNRPVPIKGQVKVRADTWYSIELGITHTVPEWDNQSVQFEQEEDAGIDSAGVASWILSRQSELYIINPI